MKFSTRHLSFLFIAALISSCSDSKGDQKPPAQQPPAIEGYVIREKLLNETIEVSGTLLPMDQVVLMPEVSGRITQLFLPEGQRVQKGTLLVKLFDADLQAQLTKLNAQLNNSLATAKRQEELLSVSGISQLEYEQTTTQVDAIRADIAGVHAQISKTEIRAPFDGTVGLRKVSEGAFVSTGTEITILRADHQLKLDFEVPEAYASLVHKGLAVSFSLPGDSTKHEAEVIATEHGVEEGTLNLRARALVKTKSQRLVPGVSATVFLNPGGNVKALLVPSSAIIPQARFKNVIVLRNGIAAYAQVQTGVRLPGEVQILSGLSEGDTIAVTGIQFIRPGMPVKFSIVK